MNYKLLRSSRISISAFLPLFMSAKTQVKKCLPYLENGEVLRDRYIVEVQIGAGGFGQIFRFLLHFCFLSFSREKITF